MVITVKILKDKLLKEHQIAKRAKELQAQPDIGYHKSYRLAEKEVSDIDHTQVIHTSLTKEHDIAALAEHIAAGRNYKFESDGIV